MRDGGGMQQNRPEFLMCSPEHYGIRYVINPWMKLSRPSDPERSCTQWNALHEILQELAGTIHVIAPASGLPDMVFTANAGLPLGGRLFLSRFRHEQRQPESRHFRRWFEAQGFDMVEFPGDVYFEGAGDALFLGSTLFAGYRYRSDIRAHTLIAERQGIQVLSLELADRRFYHLDTCFAPLNSESALYYPKAFDPYARQVIEANVEDPIAVPAEEALRFVCNAVVIGRDVVIHRDCPRTRKALDARGFTVHETDLSEFIKAGGSAKCLTLQIR
jgi:N-dimethylarginine dimethylaminohydrolase